MLAVEVYLFYHTPVVIILGNKSQSERVTGKQLAYGCYAVAWVGVEPTTIELQGSALSTVPLRPIGPFWHLVLLAVFLKDLKVGILRVVVPVSIHLWDQFAKPHHSLSTNMHSMHFSQTDSIRIYLFDSNRLQPFVVPLAA